jgi:uncharacterized protein YukE
VVGVVVGEQGVAGMADEPADQLRRLAATARGSASRMHDRRVALARSALVWWQGGAAEAYQQAVQERVNALANLGVRLDELARACDALADACEADRVARGRSGGAVRYPGRSWPPRPGWREGGAVER